MVKNCATKGVTKAEQISFLSQTFHRLLINDNFAVNAL